MPKWNFGIRSWHTFRHFIPGGELDLYRPDSARHADSRHPRRSRLHPSCLSGIPSRACPPSLPSPHFIRRTNLPLSCPGWMWVVFEIHLRSLSLWLRCLVYSLLHFPFVFLHITATEADSTRAHADHDLGFLLGGVFSAFCLLLFLCCLRRFLSCFCTLCTLFSLRRPLPLPALTL